MEGPNPFNPPNPDSPSASFDIRRQELSPQVRSYVDNLYVQIRQIFDKYGVANIEDLRDGVKSKQIKMETKDGEKLKNLTRWLRDTLKEKKIPEEVFKGIEGRIFELSKQLESKLNDRFLLQESPETLIIHSPELPPGLTQEHIDAIKETFPGAFEERVLPTLQDLHNLDEAYLEVMYPKKQREGDTKRGLKSYRPEWWDQPSDETITKSSETWGQAYIRSMSHELEAIGGSLVLLDTATKPKYGFDYQQYGSFQGNEKKLDHLLTLFEEAFPKGPGRFKRSWEELQTRLIPIAKKKIEESFRAKNLPIPDFEVLLIPAILDNLEMTLFNPTSSYSDTFEWTSTPLLDSDNKDSRHNLGVGISDRGGAGHIAHAERSEVHGNGGARLAIVFKKS